MEGTHQLVLDCGTQRQDEGLFQGVALFAQTFLGCMTSSAIDVKGTHQN